MKEKTVWKSINVLSAIGIVLAIYLFYSYLAHPLFQPCSINVTINCDAIIKGAVSKTLGIPTALYGLIGYIVILFSSLFKKRKLLLGMAAFGTLFCLRITFLEVFVIKVICPICLACQLVMLFIFFLSLRLFKSKT